MTYIKRRAFLAIVAGSALATRISAADSGARAGVDMRYASCHTAFIDGYAIEGHVPAREIKRLLQERPVAIGLAVPGMPTGSPGMEQGGQVEPYEVLLLRKDGGASTYARYPG